MPGDGFYFTSVQGNSFSLAELWNGQRWRGLLRQPVGIHGGRPLSGKERAAGLRRLQCGRVLAAWQDWRQRDPAAAARSRPMIAARSRVKRIDRGVAEISVITPHVTGSSQ